MKIEDWERLTLDEGQCVVLRAPADVELDLDMFGDVPDRLRGRIVVVDHEWDMSVAPLGWSA